MRLLTIIALAVMIALALAGIAAVQAAPLEPALSRGLARVDGLSALFALAVAGVALARLASGREQRPLRALLAAGALAAAFQTTHLALLAAGLAGAAAAVWAPAPVRPIRPFALGLVPLALCLCSGAGLAWIALEAGTWRYPVPAAGLGLNSLSFGLILAGAAGAALSSQASDLSRFWAAPSARGPQPAALSPLLAIGLLYPLYRLFSLGPWNLGWQLGAIGLGAGVSLWGAWLAATGPADEGAEGRLRAYLLGLAIAGAGLGSGAGLALGGFALLTLIVWQLWPAEAGAHPLRWLVCGAVPLTAPFVTAWIGVAAALGAGSTLLGMALWAGALLAAVPIARGSQKAEGGGQKATDQAMLDGPSALRPSGMPHTIAAILSLTLGIASPLVVGRLLEPMIAQLQGGLTPFGEVRLWPWAGLLGLDAARQPVATLPSVALGALMLILAALVWAVTRLLSLWRRPEGGQDG